MSVLISIFWNRQCFSQRNTYVQSRQKQQSQQIQANREELIDGVSLQNLFYGLLSYYKLFYRYQLQEKGFFVNRCFVLLYVSCRLCFKLETLYYEEQELQNEMDRFYVNYIRQGKLALF
eukprot:TRINITY_DN25566_c0_g1_i1.p2 TRINITY_DN25566_c0_g1~~TRINITY_DN25566_c0_g1_i1.p2  ORF type:complete len:119 (-),score=0.94 TRINITY_DN25566_c0_g1_i1:244-600(-)